MSKNSFAKSLSLVLLIALFLSACGGGLAAQSAPSREESFDEFALAPAAEPGLDFAGNVAADGAAGEAFSAGATVAQSVERLVIKNADLSIVVDDPAAEMDGIIKLAEDVGGFVVTSNLFQRELESGAEVPQGSITIRVPAERFTEIITQLEGGANRILSKNVSGQDVTQEYTDLQSRLRNLEQVEDELREIMASASDTEDVLNVYNQLTNITGQIEVTKGQIQYFEQSAALSAITITLIADAAVQPLTIGGWEPAGVAKDAIQALINTLQGLANVAIWLALYLLPALVAIALPVWLVWRGVKAVRGRRAAPAAQAAAKK
jgi:hypothetical protein